MIERCPRSDGPVELSLYFLDWDRLGRIQNVQLADKKSGEVLDQVAVEDFEEGKYLRWLINSPVTVTVEKVNGPNAVLMGIFLDPVSAESTKLMQRK